MQRRILPWRLRDDAAIDVCEWKRQLAEGNTQSMPCRPSAAIYVMAYVTSALLAALLYTGTEFMSMSSPYLTRALVAIHPLKNKHNDFKTRNTVYKHRDRWQNNNSRILKFSHHLRGPEFTRSCHCYQIWRIHTSKMTLHKIWYNSGRACDLTFVLLECRR